MLLRPKRLARMLVADESLFGNGGMTTRAEHDPESSAGVWGREETFGPTIPIMGYRSFDEATALANDSDYGLGANLYSNDPRKIKQYYEEVQAGTCWVNDPLTDNDAGPFGGLRLLGDKGEQRLYRGEVIDPFGRRALQRGAPGVRRPALPQAQQVRVVIGPAGVHKFHNCAL
jgi:hypothetical protein